jgi:holliday junction DNA helicase RuvA
VLPLGVGGPYNLRPMYDYLSGQLTAKRPGRITVDVAGVGYRVEIPLSTFEKLPKSGPVKVFTWLKVSDDDLRLFGFATEREREIFLRLVDGVSQLGPAKALMILSSAPIDQLVRAIEDGDAKFFRRIKGIGEKLASRMIVELKGKLPDDGAGIGPAATSITKDAVSALLNLGYDRGQAEEAVRRALKDLPQDAAIEDVIKRSLIHV